MTNTQILIAAIAVGLAAVYFWMSRRADDAPAKPAEAPPRERDKVEGDADAKADADADADAKAKAGAKAKGEAEAAAAKAADEAA